MNKKLLTKIILSAIIILAAILRLYALNKYPVGFNADEAAIGYNAYSVLRTGYDEHGHFMPLTFESFGDYKAPLYIYLDVPFIVVFGLTEWAVRLPSALFGIATVFVVYLLTRKLFDTEAIALLAAFGLTIAPWHLHFSRGGWEVNVATFFITFGTYAFVKSIASSSWHRLKDDSPGSMAAVRPPALDSGLGHNDRQFSIAWLCLAVVSLLAAMYTYQSPKLVVPALVIGFVVMYYRQLWAMRLRLIVPIIVGIIASIALLLTFTSKSGYARFSGVSIFADTGPFWAANEARGEHADPSGIVARLFHNKVLGYGLAFVGNYAVHYSPAFLFATGDPIQRNNIPDMGVLYLIDGIFVLFGLYALFRSEARDKRLVIWWLLVAPVAAAITFQTPHALRSATMVVPLVIVIALGVYQALVVARRHRAFFPVLLLIALGYTFFVSKYFYTYYQVIPKALPLANNYGFRELVPYIEDQKTNYQKIVVTQAYDQPYILFWFYAHQDPRTIQQVPLTQRDKFGFATIRSYANYEFRTITRDDLLHLKNSLLVGSPKEIDPNDPRVIKTITFPNGEPAFVILKT